MNQIKKTKESRKINYTLIPLLFVLAILPFIMRLYPYNAGLSSNPWFQNNDTVSDYFLHYKMVFFILVAIVSACIIGCDLFMNGRKVKFTKDFLPLAVYAAFTILSTMFSEHRSMSLSGGYEQFESMWAMLGYFIMAYYAFRCINTEEDVDWLFRFWFIGVGIMCLFGLLQLLGLDLFATDFGKKLYIPRTIETAEGTQNLWENLDKTQLAFGKHRVYLTLYNPNYVGLYVSLILPIVMVLLLLNKKLISGICYGLLAAGLVLCIFGSLNKTSIISLAVVMLFFILLMRKVFIRRFKTTVVVVILCVAAIFVGNALTGNQLVNGITEAFKVAFSEETEPTLSKIETKEDHVSITYRGNTLNMESAIIDEEIRFGMKDQDGKEISFTVDEYGQFFILQDDRFPEFTVRPVILADEKTIGFSVVIEGKEWTFTNQTGDGQYYYYTDFGKLDKMIVPESAFFEEKQTFASGRGYIWSKTIPLLKDTVFLGSGPDTFVTIFPQNDYVGKRNYGYENAVMTKPHNMFLQIGVQTGVLSLIAFLVFYGIYFVSSMRLYWKREFDTMLPRYGVGILLGTVGYMINGLTTDSTINVSPLFWVLIGTGMAVNLMIRKQDKLQNGDANEGILS